MTTQSPDHLDFVRTFDVQPVLTNPILDIAARFWEEERYDAFKLCYRSMRVMDDLIDDRKAIDPAMSEAEKRELATTVNDWTEAIHRGTPSDSVPDQLAEAIAHFQIPLWPWRQFSESMLYDLYHDGFATYRDFLSYAEGAAVAPGAVFMHLCGIVKTNGQYHLPRFDIREAARPLARFCYLVHILRDFQTDQHHNLNYLANDLVAQHGLSPSRLKAIATGREINLAFRNLMGTYHTFADDYRRQARLTMDKTRAYLESRYQLSLEILYSLYLQIFERIDVLNGKFTTGELCPSSEEVKDRIHLTLSSW